MLFSKNLTRANKVWAKHAHRIESYVKLSSILVLASTMIIACQKNNGNSVVSGVSILSVANTGTSAYGYGNISFTVSVGDDSGQPPQSYVLNASQNVINGDLREIGQNVYELQTTCANVNCSDVAFMIVARRGFINTSGTFNGYLGNPLSGDGVNYPYNTTTQYVLTTQPMGSVEYLYRATGTGTGTITWTLVKTLSDNTGTVSVLNATQIAALEQP